MPVSPDQAIWFIKQLTHTKGKWTGLPFDVLPFQEDFVRDLTKLDKRGQRIVRKALLGIARKNGKSELGAALALLFLVLDGEPGGEVVGAAAKRDQAKLILETAKRMVKYSKIGGRPLSDFLVVRRDAIYYPEMDSVYRVVSADAEKEHGLNPHAIIFDELHVQGERRDLWEALTTAQGARENPILVSLTTAGPAPRGLAYDEYKYGEQVNAGIINDPEFLMRWWQADLDLPIDDERAWKQANPGYGHMVHPAFIKKAAADVIAGRSPEYPFRRLHLNQWTTALERWLPRRMWDKCGRPASMPDGSTIWIGVDAATHRDSFGVSWVRVDTEMVEDQETGLFKPTQVAHIKVKAFLPASEGEYIDQEEVRTFIMGLAARYRVESLLYDPAYMGLMAQQLEDAGVVCEPYPQSGEKMVFASETFQRLVLNCQLRHGKDRVLDEQLSAVGTRETERGVRVSKAKSGARIDVVVALVMALAGAMGDEGGGDFAMLM